MPNKNRLSIYMIKDDFVEVKDIVDNYDDEVTIPDVGTVYINRSHMSVPIWTSSFFVGHVSTANVFTANARALLLVSIPIDIRSSDKAVQRKIFAVTFGYGKNMLKDNVVEERFGLKVILNTIKPNSLRRIHKINIGGNQKLSSEQLPLKSGINDFGLDINRDLVSSIAGVSDDDEYVSGIIAGSDLLSVTAEVDVNNIVEFLKKTYGKYCLTTYKRNFAWIDQIQEVKDSRLIDVLNNKLIEAINNSSTDVWMAVPEIIEWSDIRGFKYYGREIWDDIYVDKVRESFRDSLTSIEQLKSKRIVAISAIDEAERFGWSANRCLFGEITDDGKSYCVNNGKWYHVDSDFVQKINDDYWQTPISTIEFNEYSSTYANEKEYSKAFSDSQPETYLLMDAKNIIYGGGHSRIELCDILSTRKELIHIKQYAGSSTLSHLFNQAAISAELIKSDAVFLEKANEKIMEISDDNSYLITNADGIEIVFGIISKDENDLPNLPFFSKVSFRFTKQRLTAFGYAVCIKRIKKELPFMSER